jgi:hypothetical protein
MSEAPAPEPSSPPPFPGLVFDDPAAALSADDSDRGWGDDRPTGGPADLARFLDEKPPHHG